MLLFYMDMATQSLSLLTLGPQQICPLFTTWKNGLFVACLENRVSHFLSFLLLNLAGQAHTFAALNFQTASCFQLSSKHLFVSLVYRG
jgi:hypothetical protein